MSFGLFENVFFRRKKKLEGKEKDYYSYKISEETRWRIIHIVFENLLSGNELGNLLQKLAKEFGRPTISSEILDNNKIQDFILNSPEEELLTSIELSIALKNQDILNRDYYNRHTPAQKMQDFILQINKAFKLDKIGYEIVSVGLEDLHYIIVPIDSKYLYTETIKRTLTLLHDVEFRGSLQEFESALDEYRNERYDNVILKANKAFESTLKAILTKKRIPFDEKNDKITILIKKLFESPQFIDPALKDAFNKVRGILESGLPTIRNQPGVAHGQGLDPKNVAKSYAEIALHLAGTYIVFLIGRYKES